MDSFIIGVRLEVAPRFTLIMIVRVSLKVKPSLSSISESNGFVYNRSATRSRSSIYADSDSEGFT